MRKLKENGWELLKIQGSHHVFGKLGCRPVPVPFHGNTDFLLVLRHYTYALSYLSDLKCSGISACSFSFSSNNSGTAYLTRSISASNEPDSSTSPGTSSLVAIQTLACESQSNFIVYSAMVSPPFSILQYATYLLQQLLNRP